MKLQFRHKFFYGLMLLTALVSLVPSSVFAAGNSMAFTPASGSSEPGNTFTLSVDGYANGSWFGGASSATGSISFPAGLLNVTSTSLSGSTFASGTVTPDNTNGTIKFNISCTGWFCGVSGQNVHLFTISFQSVAPGAANVSFASASYNTGAAATTGGTYTIEAPPAPPAPAPTPTPQPTPKPSAKPVATPKIVVPSIAPLITSTPEVTPVPVSESDGGLQIENVKVSATRQQNSVTWTLNNANASPVLTYGPDKTNQNDAVVTKQGDGSYQAIFPDLKFGALYYFTIKAATPDNLQGANYDGTFTTRGYPVQLTIEQNDLLLPGAKVKIGERSFVANKNAIITTELGDGHFTASITPPDSSGAHTADFTVAKKSIPDSGDPDLQSFILNITAVGSSTGLSTSVVGPLIAGAAALLAIGGGIFGFIFYRRRQVQEAGAAIDSDLLSDSYGTKVQALRTNTPEPNLGALGEGAGEAAFAEAATIQVPLPPEAAAPAGLPFSEIQQVSPEVPVPEGVAPIAPVIDNSYAAPQSFDPSAMPLPPTDSTAVTQPMITSLPPDAAYAATAATVPAPAPAANDQYSEEEQLAPELAQVEATSQIVPAADDEPSAVYDASTGELDIIHHHAGTHTPEAPAPEVAPLETPVAPTATQPQITIPAPLTDVSYQAPIVPEPIPVPQPAQPVMTRVSP